LVELSGIEPLTSSSRKCWETHFQQLSCRKQSTSERKTIDRNHYWTQIGPELDPDLGSPIGLNNDPQRSMTDNQRNLRRLWWLSEDSYSCYLGW